VLIDWFTVFAQIVNFLILVFLLRRFLYGPIVNAMQAREDRIRQQLEAAEAEHREAEEIKDDYLGKRQELDEQQDRLIVQAREEAEAWRKEQMDKARAEVDEAQRHWHEAVQREKELFLRELRQRTGQEVVAIARRALADLADADLEAQMAKVFLQRLQATDPTQREEIVRSIRDSERGIAVQSAFRLPPEQRDKFKALVAEMVGDGVPLEFVTNADLLAGIELKAGSYHIAWSLNEHLAGLEQDMADLLAGESPS
jgi:F-type H+-transporting ATPase subunit b